MGFLNREEQARNPTKQIIAAAHGVCDGRGEPGLAASVSRRKPFIYLTLLPATQQYNTAGEPKPGRHVLVWCADDAGAEILVSAIDNFQGLVFTYIPRL